MIGQTISHYRITDKLGEGGMGVVYKAEDTKLKRNVAIKFLVPHLLRDAEGRKRFEREAMAAAALDHPNVCTVYEIDEADGQTFIVMAYLEGQPLSEKIAEGPLKLPEALSIARQMAEGLEAAHQRGIVHRDVKPDNVMLIRGSRGLVKLMDFGLAQLAGSSKFTRDGTTLGTVAYMSPQQAEGSEVDHRTDIWALGVVLYEMLGGRPPFRGDFDQAIIYSIMNEPPRPLTAVRAGVPRKLEGVANKCLAKRAEDRYQHVDELLVDLRTVDAELSNPSAASPIPAASVRPRWANGAWPLAIGLIALATLSVFWALNQGEIYRPREAWKISRITATPELEFHISGSPASSLIAYSSTAVGNMDIYVMPFGGGNALRLTEDASDEFDPRLSPDGQFVVFSSSRGGNLYSVPVTGGTPRFLTRTNVAGPRGMMGANPWRSRASRQELLFSRVEKGGRVAIWKLGLESLEETQISHPQQGERHTNASYSPDGEQIAFSRHSGGRTSLWLMDADGGRGQPVLEDEFNNIGASWAPDGERLLFRSDRSGPSNIWELSIASGELRQITVGLEEASEPVVVPGKGLFYIQFSHSLNLFKLDVETGNHQSLTQASDVEQTNPRFSPDARFLVFDTNRHGDFEISKLDLRSGEITPVTDNREHDRYPDWSPVANDLLFVSDRDGEPAIWVMDAEGRGSRRLSADPGAITPFFATGTGGGTAPPRWSPDGARIGYVGMGDSGPELWSLSAKGSDANRLLEGVHSFDWYGDSGRVVIYAAIGSESGPEEASLRAVNLDTNEKVVLLAGLYANLDVAPDASSVAFLSQDGHLSQNYFALSLAPADAESGLPRAAGVPKPLTEGRGLWHVHGGSYSPDGSSFVYDRDLDEGDILLIENYQ